MNKLENTAAYRWSDLKNSFINLFDEIRISMSPEWYRNDHERLNKTVIQLNDAIRNLQSSRLSARIEVVPE